MRNEILNFSKLTAMAQDRCYGALFVSVYEPMPFRNIIAKLTKYNIVDKSSANRSPVRALITFLVSMILQVIGIVNKGVNGMLYQRI